MSKTIHIFIGPMKTGTTWLHELMVREGLAEGGGDKEIKFPARFGQRFVYRRFIAGRGVLIWPYLLHYPAHMEALVRFLQAEGHAVKLYAAWRAPASWQGSMGRYRARAGRLSAGEQGAQAESEYARIRAALRQAGALAELRCLRIINPRPRDVALMAEVTGLDPAVIEAARDEKVYATVETARVSTRWLGRTFFAVKPFLPRALRQLNRRSLGLGRIFFRG